ncbi:bifunctional methylenetetrahydrofolate dehydrogenase/methenyltetrahydrofolate cyclohydrolase FolD [Sneathiella glossodoripedis]|uniref:bifunctional methylenetetrahydrofolate dehydrogenase/methenyltetrahydrofolate cyclohydrolase FolD n=1 Tax=Sneathiella glossodoripedis TaxID=418853 RepID=UPI00046F46BA|nr:bifunctional methylenetetrahydrofolate dehydrogenase/methenyltetrahydrofolate cyclohydrolase FolD [Sneathiella glossodoripedis]
MAGQKIDGKQFAESVRERVARQVDYLQSEHKLKPGLAVVLVGEDPASQVYVRNKNTATLKAGMKSEEIRLEASASQEEVLEVVRKLNEDSSIHGILVQLPLPPQVDETAVINAIDPAKDVDGFHVINTGRQAVGLDAMMPCTPLGCITLLKERLGDLSGLNAVVVGRSNIVGKPMASLLLAESCTVTIAHSRTKDLPEVCKRADILVAAVGRPEMIRGDWIKPGATVIDVGINRVNVDGGKTRLVGDVNFEEAIAIAEGVTPVPGGVGPMTIAFLLVNTVTAACRAHNIQLPEDI